MKVYNEEDLRAEFDKISCQKREKSASENVKAFYSNNETYINTCYNYFLQYDAKREEYINGIPCVEIDELKKELRGKIILVLTANPIEEGILLHSLADVGKEKLGLFWINNYAYQVCHLNEYTIVHVHARRTGEEFTRRAINAASSIFNPDTIILLGICYGIDFQNNKLGDVLISSVLRNYRLNFRDSDENEETIFEAEEEDSERPNKELISNIEGIFPYRIVYSFIPEINGSKVTVNWKSGTILSSNSLLSSKRVKEAVIKAFGAVKPKPIGGEMEGGGLLKAKIVEEQNLDCWLIVKGICDWGEKKNLLAENLRLSNHMKDAIQAMAMVHAWSVFYEMVMLKYL